jgi:hypothetical protein
MLIPTCPAIDQLRHDQLLGRGQRLVFLFLVKQHKAGRQTDRQIGTGTRADMSYHCLSVECTLCLVRIPAKIPRPECSSNPAYDRRMTKLEDLGFKSRKGQDTVVFSKISWPALWFTKTPMTPANTLHGGKAAGAWSWLICSAQVKHEWTNNSAPLYALMTCTGTSPSYFSIPTWHINCAHSLISSCLSLLEANLSFQKLERQAWTSSPADSRLRHK